MSKDKVSHPTNAKGNGAARKWLLDRATFKGEDCVPWPFHWNRQRGYGQFCYCSKNFYAHRFMCELANGKPPSPKHQAAHSCNNRRCVNPRHLSWKTNGENQKDRAAHGTKNDPIWTKRGKLTADQVVKIRALSGFLTQEELARAFGVGCRNIGMIQNGKTWKHILQGSIPACDR